MNQQESQSQAPAARDPMEGATESAAVLAHELKTPLSIISAYVQLLLSYKTGPLNDQQYHVLAECDRNCQRLKKLVENFLNLARQNVGKMEVDYQRGDLAACVRDVCDLLLPRFREKGVTLKCHAAPAIPQFPFDHAKTTKVAIELLDNALKFTPPKGAVTLSVQRWASRSPTPAVYEPREKDQRALESAPEYVEVRVADTGPGIHPEYHRAIFEPFVRLPQVGGTVEGAGLGLAIARRLIEAQSGNIWVNSEPGMGSTFFFLLPSVPPGHLAY